MPQPERSADTPVDIFVHVPKTAGLSLRTMVIDHYGAESTWIYSSASKLFFRADKQLFQPSQINSLPVNILKKRGLAPLTRFIIGAHNRRGVNYASAHSEADAIIGHYPSDTFDSLSDARKQRHLTVVREPLARMASHYRYRQENRGMATHLLGRMEGEDTSLSFRDFALSGIVRNIQTRYVGSDLSRYEVVGLTERFPQFLMRAGLIESDTVIPHTNRSKLPSDDIADATRDAGFVREFQEYHAEDYQMYKQALEIAP